MILRETLVSWKTELTFWFCNKSVDLLYYEAKEFPQKQTVNIFKKWVQKQKATKLYNIKSNFVSPIYTLSSVWNLIVYTPIHGTNREKYLNHTIYEGKMPTLAGNKLHYVHFYFHRSRHFHLSTEKKYKSSPSKIDSKVVIPAPTQ